MPEEPFNLPFIECAGDPRRMGRQYGEAARAGILENRAMWHTEEKARAGAAEIRACAEFLRTAFSEVYAELEGLSEGSGVPLAEILLFNQWCLDLPGVGCTPLAVRGGPSGPLVAKNNDGNPKTPGAFVIRRSTPTSGLPMLQVTYAGWLSGLDAMNAAGLANTHASVGSIFPRPGPGIDIRLRAYQALRTCETTPEFLDALGRRMLTGKGFNLVVNDSAGETAVVEAAVPVLAIRDRAGSFVYATNHFITAPLKDADRRSPAGKEVSQYRFGYLRWVEATGGMPASAEDMEALLARHEPWAPCRHGGPQISETFWSMIALCRERRVRVCDGFPCRRAYRSFTVT